MQLWFMFITISFMGSAIHAMQNMEMHDMQLRDRMKQIISGQTNLSCVEHLLQEKGDMLVKVIKEDYYTLAQSLIPLSNSASVEAAYMEISGIFKEGKSFFKGIFNPEYRTAYNKTVDMIEKRLTGPRWRCRSGELYKRCCCSSCLMRMGCKMH